MAVGRAYSNKMRIPVRLNFAPFIRSARLSYASDATATDADPMLFSPFQSVARLDLESDMLVSARDSH